MELFVLRHGEAQAHAARDRDRQLTAHGRDQVSTNIQSKRVDLGAVQAIWASPYVRAQQTAALVSAQLPQIPVENSDLLVPDADLVQLGQSLQESELSSVLLVSHQPLVGTLVNWLCGLPAGRHNMSTATLACIDCEFIAADLGELRWLQHPRV